MTMAVIENYGPGPVKIHLADGSWLEIQPGERKEADIMRIEHGNRRAHYAFNSLGEQERTADK